MLPSYLVGFVCSFGAHAFISGWMETKQTQQVVLRAPMSTCCQSQSSKSVDANWYLNTFSVGS